MSYLRWRRRGCKMQGGMCFLSHPYCYETLTSIAQVADVDPPNKWKGCDCNKDPDFDSFPKALSRPNAEIQQNQKIMEDLPNRPDNVVNQDGGHNQIDHD